MDSTCTEAHQQLVQTQPHGTQQRDPGEQPNRQSQPGCQHAEDEERAEEAGSLADKIIARERVEFGRAAAP
jgi:hypothetical protein